MSLLRPLILTLALFPIAAGADEAVPKADPAKAEAAKPVVKKHMKPKDPMAGEMKKPGMTQGDVKKAAEKKDRQMKEPMKQEERKMR